MKAITTRYNGPTDTKGARISASDEDGNRVSIPYPHEVSGGSEAKHAEAARRLCLKMGWSGVLVAGAAFDSSRRGYAFCWLEETSLYQVGERSHPLLLFAELIASGAHPGPTLRQQAAEVLARINRGRS